MASTLVLTTVLKMNRNWQINLPSAFISNLSLGEGNYFKASLEGNQIVLTPIDPVERVFTDADLDAIEKVYQKEKKLGKPVTPAWIKKTFA